MKDQNALKVLAKVMGWEKTDLVSEYLPKLQLLANYKYDHYQQFSPGKKFIESLALWLNQFELKDRETALNFVMEKLIFISDAELSHLVDTAYPDQIVQERIRLVAGETGRPIFHIGKTIASARFSELTIKTLYLGLSDGARTNELRRAGKGEISNEQIWQAYELGEEKAGDMIDELRNALDSACMKSSPSRFNLVWLIDDFSGSGNTYIRYDADKLKFKGKIKKIYERLNVGDLVDKSHYEVYLLLYIATRQAIDHIEYWAERFTSENGYKPLQLRVISIIDNENQLVRDASTPLGAILTGEKYYDDKAHDKHTKIGGTEDVRMGFAECGLPIVLSHNTPNNSVYILWGPASYKFQGLFPRVSRHKEF
tara:strand:+ start:3177 stop:4283 length:1107 start_codon:yes stop_codon:yes gene_type:complete